jgi:polysaccharide biosynthesis protein PslH
MTRVRFILQRHPFDPNGGGTSLMSRLMMEAAADACDVRGTVLSSTSFESPWPLDRLDKPPLRPLQVLARSAVSRRSLIHTRFRVDSLREQLRRTDDDRYVPNHTYMAESYLDAFGDTRSDRLYINTIVSEADVLRTGTNWTALRGLEAHRTERDEIRCLTRARAVSGFDAVELDRVVRHGDRVPFLLHPALPPQTRSPVSSARHLLFLGDRAWAPNYEALVRLLALWPRIRAGSPRAELLVVGRGPVPKASAGDGIRTLGYIDSLDPVWHDARALVAPITRGGGVRVKILEAACRGVPVVATTAGIGSIASYLPLRPCDDDKAMVADCVALLRDSDMALQRADELYEANRAWWNGGNFGDEVRRWLDLDT